jgi:hypothetical protein
VRWSGQVQAQYSQTYTFYARVNDGVRLWVGGKLLIDQWKEQTTTEYSGSIDLQAGQRYDIRVEYFDATGDANIDLAWSTPITHKQMIPQSQLYSTTRPTASSASVGAPPSVLVETPVPEPLPPVITPPSIDVTAPTVTIRTPVQEETYSWLNCQRQSKRCRRKSCRSGVRLPDALFG